jgi:hypothetical protein
MIKGNLFAVLVLLLSLFSCKKEKDDPLKEKRFELTGFTQIYAGEKINLTIKQGAVFNITAKGPVNNIEDLELKLTDNNKTLDIAYKGQVSAGVVDLTVTLPVLEIAYLNGHVVAAISGFNNQVGNVALSMSGSAKVTVEDGATVFAIEAAGNSQLDLHGFTASLAGTVLGNAVVNAYGLTATRVYINSLQQSKVYVRPTHIFYGEAGGQSRIFYKGDPQDKELVTTENGQIIKE